MKFIFAKYSPFYLFFNFHNFPKSHHIYLFNLKYLLNFKANISAKQLSELYTLYRFVVIILKVKRAVPLTSLVGSSYSNLQAKLQVSLKKYFDIKKTHFNFLVTYFGILVIKLTASLSHTYKGLSKFYRDIF
jgi:hypothetical protein